MTHPHRLLRVVAHGEAVEGSHVTAAVVESAMEHRMALLLLGAVAAPEEIPTKERTLLIAFRMTAAARRQQQDAAMVLVHERLTAAGVTHTFVKGAVSATRWFDEPSERPYSDIDILVQRGEPLLAAIRALDDSHPILTSFDSQIAESLSSVDMTVGGVPVDIQTDALRMGLTPRQYDSWSIGHDELEFESGERFRVLDPEHDMVMFLLHQGRDRFRYLLGVVEADRRLKNPPDWKRVEEISRAEGIWEQVAVALEVICNELEIQVPMSMPAGWRTALWRRLWGPQARLPGESGQLRHINRARWIMPLTMRGRIIEGMAWFARSLFPPDPVLRLRHPSASGPYLWRVVSTRVRVIGRRRMWVWKHSRKHKT